jgi:arylformamidase
MEIIDISQTIRRGIPVWPGDQKYHQRWTMRMKENDPCNVSAVTMTTHLGTHVDAPYHCDNDGLDIAAVSLRHYIGPARVESIMVQGSITPAELGGIEWQGVERILLKTRSSGRAEGRFEREYVSFTEEAAEYLGEKGILLVGTDAPSVDSFHSSALAIHKILMRHGIAILEGIRLDHVKPGDYELICLPLRFAGLDGSPVRAILRR